MPLAGRPLVEWSIAAMQAAAGVRSVVVAVPPEVVAGSSSRYPDVSKLGPDSDSTTFVAGGATRAKSVSNALQVVETELVAIHDAARPLVTPELMEDVVATLLADPEAAGAIAAAPVTDTIKRAAPFDCSFARNSREKEQRKGVRVKSTLDRGVLWAAQTPQVFRAEALRGAIEAYPADAPEPTDEAMPIEVAGGRVLIHPAPAENIKVTTPSDLRLAEALLAER